MSHRDLFQPSGAFVVVFYSFTEDDDFCIIPPAELQCNN